VGNKDRIKQSNGLYYMRARYYNSDIRRFINRDIVEGSIRESQTLNRFCYVQGNPIRLIDPFGLNAQDYARKAVHTVFDIGGMIFDPLDFINCVMYAAEGDKANAIISGVSGALPFVGDAMFKGGSKAVVKAAGDSGSDKVIKMIMKEDADDFARNVAEPFYEKLMRERGIPSSLTPEQKALGLQMSYTSGSNKVPQKAKKIAA